MKQTILLIACYLLGSIPFGLLIVKAWCGVDITKHGSGNIGATNVMRTAGKIPAIIVFIADVMKGFVPVLVARAMFPEITWLPVIAGLMSMLGHTLSIFLKFKGGKGVATGLGIIVGLNPAIAGMGFGIWVIFVYLTRYVSLASMVGATSIGVLMFVFHQPLAYKLFTIAAVAFIIFKHRSNIARLVQGKEARWGEKVAIPEKE